MKRIWSPLGAVRRWRLGRVDVGRERLSLRIERRRVTMSWEVRINDSRRGRDSCRIGGDGRGGAMFRISSLETYGMELACGWIVGWYNGR